MRHEPTAKFDQTSGRTPPPVDVTIVMPCLNEVQCLPHCITNAQEALRRIQAEQGLTGEIVIADNGSTDGSQMLATGLGARVVHVEARGYGAALIGGGEAARGRFILMGDADGSYDFTDGVAMIERLAAGADVCMGSRFLGGIAPGAMPWKNRYIGNPVLTGILNLLFRSGISDAHCGLRAIRKDTFLSLGLTGSGMEFASEMVIKAALRKVRMEEVPARLLADLRDRAPHLRPWRDGWRHLRYLFMLSPTWLFGAPALLAAILATVILVGAVLGNAGMIRQSFGSSWSILAGGLIGIAHLGALMAIAGKLHGILSGYRVPSRRTQFLAKTLNLETMLLAGLAMLFAGLAGMAATAVSWANSGFLPLSTVLPVVLSVTSFVVGLQNMLGGFLLAVIAGNDAAFLGRTTVTTDAATPDAKTPDEGSWAEPIAA